MIPCAKVSEGEKRQRTDLKKMDGRNMQKHQKENKITDDTRTKKRGKDGICVINWNVNKSSAQCDFWRDIAQCQANVVMFQETQSWQEDGTAEEFGWTSLKEKKEGKAAIAVKRKSTNLLRHSRRSTRWVLVVLQSILFLPMNVPHTCCGEANLEEKYTTLKDLDKNLQDVKQRYHISGITAGTDAQVEVKPRQGSFVGDDTRMSSGSTTRYFVMESKFESLLMEWITNHEIKLANTFAKIGYLQERGRTSLTSGNRMKNCYRSGRSLATLLSPSSGKQEAQCPEPYTSLASDDLCTAGGKERRMAI